MKVLVTGASGFIGNYTIKELLKYPEVKITASLRNLSKIENTDWKSKVQIIPGDLYNREINYYDYFNKPDILIHLTWESLNNYNDISHIESILYNNYNFIRNMILNGLKSVNITGTCLEYGLQNGCLDEDMNTFPTTPYALAKDTLRKFILELSKKYDFNFKWIRIFYMYGEGQNPKSLLEQLSYALNNDQKVFNMSGGDQLRDYLPVEEVAKYIVNISIQNELTGVFNCCSGEPISVRKLVENYLIQKNKSIKLNLGYYPYPDYEPMAFWGNKTKLNNILKDKYES